MGESGNVELPARTAPDSAGAAGDKAKPEPCWEIREVEDRPTSPAEWNAVVETSADACLYHRAEIAPLFLDPSAGKLSFVECRLDGKLVGGAILVVMRHRWHRFFNRSSVRASLGPLAVPPFAVDGLNAKTAEAAFDRLIDACVAVAEAQRSDFIVLFDAPISQRVMVERPIQNRYYTSTHWSNLVMYDYVLDLRQDGDELWKNLSSSQRGHIRRARERLQVLPGSELTNGKEAYAELMEGMFARENFRLLSREQLNGVFEHVYGGVNGQAFFGLADGKPVCVAGISKSGKMASYLHAARTDEAMNGAASLALWSGIEWARSAGCEWFELGGIIPEKDRERLRAIREFKKSFGGQIIQVHGGRREFRLLTKTTCEFIDAWGAQCKGLFRRANPWRR
jgi:hypothetical protein